MRRLGMSLDLHTGESIVVIVSEQLRPPGSMQFLPNQNVARRVRQQQIANAKHRQCAHRKHHRVHRVAFVEVRAPAQHDHRRAAQPPNDQFSRVSAHADRRKARQLPVGNLLLHFHLAECVVEAAAENDGQRRAQARELFDFSDRSIHWRNLTTDAH
jgi:hypothetical protein